MMKSHLWLAAIAAGALAIAGCKTSRTGDYVPTPQKAVPGGAAPAGQETTLFPVKVGSQWTYTSTTQNSVNGRPAPASTSEVTYKCVNVKPSGSGVEATFDVLSNGVVKEHEIWRIDKSGIYQMAIGKKPNLFSAPMPILKFPVQPGTSSTWKGTITADDGTSRSGSLTMVVGGVEQIDTDMGPYMAQPSDATGTLSSTKQQSQVAQKLWFIPNVGMGRMRQESVNTVKVNNAKVKDGKAVIAVISTMKLKNYSPGK